MTDEQGNRLIKAVLFVSSELEKHNKYMETITENGDILFNRLEEIEKSLNNIGRQINQLMCVLGKRIKND